MRNIPNESKFNSKRKVLVNVCDWTNSFERFCKKIILAAILNLSESRDRGPMCHVPNFFVIDSEHKSSIELTRLEQRFWSYFEKSVIWRPSWKMADCETLPPLANVHHRNSFSTYFDASNDI